MAEAKPARTVLYARVSTEEQGSEGHHSLDAQLHEMRDYVESKGWEVVGEFVEMMTGSRRDRPELETILDMARSKTFDVLVVHELSRLSRSVYHTLDIFDILGKHSIGFAAVKNPDFDFADPTKRFFLIIIAAISEYYINLLKLHTSKSKRERARKGLYNASIAPFGYALSGDPSKPYGIVPNETAAICRAFEMCASGRYSDRDIAEALNADGCQTRKGRRFSKDTIAQILRNPFYVGKVTYHLREGQGSIEIYEGAHEAIVSEDLWDKSQQQRATRRTASRAVQKPYRIYLLATLARCDACGRKLRSQHTRTLQYYREMSGVRGYLDCPHQSIGVRADVVERQVQAIVNAIDLPPDWRARLADHLEDDEEVSRLRRRRESLEAERRRLKEMYLRGDFDDDPDLYQTELARVRRELDRLPTYDQLESMGITMEAIQSLRDIWPTAAPADQRDLLRLMVREVHIDMASVRVTSIIPQTVMVPIFRQIPFLVERDFGVFTPVWLPAHLDDGVVNLQPLLPAHNAGGDKDVLPFFAAWPNATDSHIRIAPALAHALVVCRRVGNTPEIVMQATAPDRPLMPADLRKWPTASANALPISEILSRQPESVDILSTTLALWDNAVGSHRQDPEEIMKCCHDVLAGGGVWYLAEFLPADMPAHWLYTYFPDAWQWIKVYTLNLHTLYGSLQTLGFKSEVKRQTFYQRVKAGAALSLAEQRSTVLSRLAVHSFEQGFERLRGVVAQHGPEYELGSEVTMVEVWAQKAK